MPHTSRRHVHGDDAAPFLGTAARYDRLARLLMRRPYRRIAADVAAGLPRDASVLDVGTGPGRLLLEIAAARPDARLTGVDLAPDMIERTRANLSPLGERATALVGDARDLPFEDGAFDLVVATLTLHHWSDPAAGGAELRRVVRPGGRIRVYDVRSAPFTAFGKAAGAPDCDTTRFRITALPVPVLRRLVIETAAP